MRADAGRAASDSATSAIRSPATSVAMCVASAMSANEPNAKPATTSTIRKPPLAPRLNQRALRRGVVGSAGSRIPAGGCWCPATPHHRTESIDPRARLGTRLAAALLDELDGVEQWQVEGDDHAADHHAHHHDEQRLDERGQRVDGGL